MIYQKIITKVVNSLVINSMGGGSMGDKTVIATPQDCKNRLVGRRFWAFVAEPESVKDCNERLKLIAHPSQCEACLREALKQSSIFDH